MAGRIAGWVQSTCASPPSRRVVLWVRSDREGEGERMGVALSIKPSGKDGERQSVTPHNH